MARKAVLTLRVERDWTLDDEFYAISPKLKDLDDESLLDLLKDIWLDNISDDALVMNHIHGEIIDG